MKNTPYLAKYQIESIKPHIHTFFKKQCDDAIETLKKSTTYREFLEEYLTTDNYTQLLKDLRHNTAAKEVSNIVKAYVENRYDDEGNTSFSDFVHSLLFYADVIRYNYPLSWSITNRYNDVKFTKENYVIEVNDLIEDMLDATIEEAQMSYANDKMNFRYYTSVNAYQKIEALLATANNVSLADIEGMILNNFNFEEEVIRTNSQNDICEGPVCF